MPVTTSKNIPFRDDEITVISSFVDFNGLAADFGKEQWIFRAVGRWNQNWENPEEKSDRFSIHSTFDEAWDRRKEVETTDERYLYESWMLLEFKREAHRFLQNLPDKNDFLEWMALARQYEMPSRLLDFSYSLYVATYFALSLRKRNEDGCILAINLTQLMKDVESKLEKTWRFFEIEGITKLQASFHDKRVFHAFAFNNHLDDVKLKPGLYVAAVNPLSKNPRLGAQQGVFLCPADANASFEENLRETILPLKKNVKKLIRIKAEGKSEILAELRKMNISIASLYTDLTGHAQAQRDLVHEELHDPIDMHTAELKRAISMDCLI